MSRTKRDTSKKRDSILDAAARIFATVGYEGCSMDQIAQAANASKRTVYNHFPCKETLFREVVERFMADSHELKKIPYDPEQSLESQLGQFADSMLAITQNQSWLGLMKVMTGVVIRSPELLAETLARVNTQEDTLAAWMKAAIADGRLQSEQSSLAASVFWAMLQGAFLLPAIYGQSMTTRKTAAMKNELIQMFLARYECR